LKRQRQLQAAGADCQAAVFYRLPEKEVARFTVLLRSVRGFSKARCASGRRDTATNYNTGPQVATIGKEPPLLREVELNLPQGAFEELFVHALFDLVTESVEDNRLYFFGVFRFRLPEPGAEDALDRFGAEPAMSSRSSPSPESMSARLSGELSVPRR